MSGDDKYADLSRLPLEVAAAYRAGMSAGYDLGFGDSGEGWNGEYPRWCETSKSYARNKAETIAADLAARDRAREDGA